MSEPKFAINKNNSGKFYFNFITASGVTLLSSHDFGTKEECEGHIKDLKESITEVPSKSLKMHKATLSEEFYYVVNDKEGNEIATSKPYDSREEAEKGESLLVAEIGISSVEDHSA